MVLESSASKADEVKGPKDDESAAKHEMDANESKIIKQKVNDGKSELKREVRRVFALAYCSSCEDHDLPVTEREVRRRGVRGRAGTQ